MQSGEPVAGLSEEEFKRKYKCERFTLVALVATTMALVVAIIVCFRGRDGEGRWKTLPFDYWGTTKTVVFFVLLGCGLVFGCAAGLLICRLNRVERARVNYVKQVDQNESLPPA